MYIHMQMGEHHKVDYAYNNIAFPHSVYIDTTILYEKLGKHITLAIKCIGAETY